MMAACCHARCSCCSGHSRHLAFTTRDCCAFRAALGDVRGGVARLGGAPPGGATLHPPSQRMDTDDTDALERLKRLAQQADDLKVSPPPKSSANKPQRSYDVKSYLARAPKHGQNNTNRNAVLVFAAGLVRTPTGA